jgi:hypothetical protein
MIVYRENVYYGSALSNRDPATTGREVTATLPGCDDSGGQDPDESGSAVQVVELVDVPIEAAFLWHGSMYLRDGYTAVPDVAGMVADRAVSAALDGAGLEWERRCRANTTCEVTPLEATSPAAGSVVPVGTAVAAAEADGNVDGLRNGEPPTETASTLVGRSFDYDLLTHCGIRWAIFAGKRWITQYRGDRETHSAPEGWDQPLQQGQMQVVTEEVAVFTSEGHEPLTFRATTRQLPRLQCS